jgi:hypothetical protein
MPRVDAIRLNRPTFAPRSHTEAGLVRSIHDVTSSSLRTRATSA